MKAIIAAAATGIGTLILADAASALIRGKAFQKIWSEEVAKTKLATGGKLTKKERATLIGIAQDYVRESMTVTHTVFQKVTFTSTDEYIAAQAESMVSKLEDAMANLQDQFESGGADTVSGTA